MLALAALVAVMAVDVGWPGTPPPALEPADDCACIDCDDDGPDSALAALDLDDDFAPVLPFRVPSPSAAGRLQPGDQAAVPRSRAADNLFRPPRSPLS
jgi:hypothetical protein